MVLDYCKKVEIVQEHTQYRTLYLFLNFFGNTVL